MKKIINWIFMFLILIILIIPTQVSSKGQEALTLIGLTSVLGLAFSMQQGGNWHAKAVCMASSGPACETLELIVDPAGQVKILGLSKLPAGFQEGYQSMVNPEGYITGKAFMEISKDVPELNNLRAGYDAVQKLEQLGIEQSAGADIRIKNDGTVTEASFEIGDNTADISQIVGVEEGTITVEKGIKVDKKEGKTKLTFKGDQSSATIDGVTFSNIQSKDKYVGGDDAYIEVDEKGEVTKAEFTCSKSGTTYRLGNDKFVLNEGMNVKYDKDLNNLWIYGNNQKVTLNERDITLNGKSSILVTGNTIDGKDFTLDSKNFKGVEGKTAEVTLVEEGYLLGKSTIMESDRLIITSGRENVLFSKTCYDISGYNNYVNPCKRTLTMEGQLTAQLKEGKSFGLNIEEDDTLIYDLKGGKVELFEGVADIVLPKDDSSVEITNGKGVIVHERKDGKVRIITDARYIGEKQDVEVDTFTAIEEWGCAVETGEDGSVTASYCSDYETIEYPVTARAITDVTGMQFFEKCKKIVQYKTGLFKGEPVKLHEGIILYPNTIKIASKEEAGGDCLSCNYYQIISDKGEIYISIDPNGVSGYWDEAGTPHIFNDEDEKLLDLKIPPEGTTIETKKGVEEVLFSIGGVSYMKNGNIYQKQKDGTMKCMNCD